MIREETLEELGYEVKADKDHAQLLIQIYPNADKFVTDDWEQTKHFKSQGAFPDGLPKLYAELGEIMAGVKPGREEERERILAINIGLALNDIIVANHIYEMAKKKNTNTKLFLLR